LGIFLLGSHLDEVEIKNNLPKRGGWLRKKALGTEESHLY
jgi:hypothetical protein